MRVILLSLLTLFSFLIYQKAAANTITVTTNADSGPGSLREAIMLANANGTAVIDTIIFAIADISRTGRTIIPATEFPGLTSNIVIDGSSQPGNKIGTSDAKIILLINTPKNNGIFTFFKFNNVSHIEFYGLFLFYTVFTEFTSYMPVHGIEFTKSSDIVIGKPGKGNYFRGLRYAISSNLASFDDYYRPNSANITIQSNVFNNTEAGDPSIEYNNGYINPMQYALHFYNTKNIKIGGDLPTEGNTITAQNLLIRSAFTSGNGYLIIKNNYMGIRTDGTIPSQISPRIFIVIKGDYSDRMTDYDINIVGNKINGRFEIYYHSKYLRIQGNKIFDTGGNGSSVDYNLKLLVEFCSGGGIIGGDLPHEQNEIYTAGPMKYHNGWSNVPSGAIWVNVAPNILMRKNKTYCTTRYGAGVKVILFSDEPHVQIDSLGIGYVRGKATPNCKIEVFLDDDCWGCDGVAFLGQTLSNPDSSWSFSGNFNGVVIATATRADSSTSGYTEPTYRSDSVKVLQPTCGKSNGSITGIKLIHSSNNVEWHRTLIRNNIFVDTIISRELDIFNLEPGNYYFVAKLGETCRSAFITFNLKNFSPKIEETGPTISHPSCGGFNGSIYGLRIIDGNFSAYKWVDEQGSIIKSGSAFGFSPSLANLGPGSYRLIVTDTIANCSDTSNWYRLINQSGPFLNTGNVQIAAATCGESNGSIVNITAENVSGSTSVQWLDSLGKIVSTSFDLKGVPAGKYRLKFRDQGGCAAIVTPYYIIPSVGEIAIDIENKIVTAGGCTVQNGNIHNVKVTGASNLKWINLTNNTIAGNSIDIYNLAPGSYQLIASNSLGCTVRSPEIVVPASQFIPITPQQASFQNGNCGENNGTIKIEGFSNQAALSSFRWINTATNQVIGTGLSVTGLGAASYEIVAVDSNGCEQVIFTQSIIVNPKPSFNTNNMTITSDKCSLQSGSISGIGLNDLQEPAAYTWSNINNNVVGHSIDLSNIGSGDYSLTVKDKAGCIIQSDIFSLGNVDNAGIPPIYDDRMIPRNTTTSLVVKNPGQGTYVLYNDPAATQILQQNTTGIFTTGILVSDKEFYIRHISGSCSSSLTKVKVTVVDNSMFAIPSAFTPNNDGLNDKLTLKIIGHIEIEYFRIYNRNGELVFSANTINTGWNGLLKGNEQPPGAYVWMAKGKDINGKTVTGKGTFLLIR